MQTVDHLFVKINWVIRVFFKNIRGLLNLKKNERKKIVVDVR